MAMSSAIVRAWALRLLRFASVGVAATALYAGLFYALLWSHVAVMPSHLIAQVLSLLASYLGHKNFTFQVQGSHALTGARFALTTLILAGSQSLLVSWLDSTALAKEVLIAVSTLYYPATSLLLHSLWTFREPKPTASRDTRD